MKKTMLQMTLFCLLGAIMHEGSGQKLWIDANGDKSEFALCARDSLLFSNKDDSLILAGDSTKHSWAISAVGNITFEKDSTDIITSAVAVLTSKSISYDFDSIAGITFEPEIIDTGDWDNDGLSSRDEMTKYMTNPKLADTDGDGFSDYNEVFDGKNGRIMNPLIADLPEVAIEMRGYPDIDLIETRGNSKSRSKTVEKGETIENSTSQNESFGRSSTTELGWMNSLELGRSDSHFTFNLTSGTHATYSYETKTDYGFGRTSGYERSINQSLSEMEDSSWSATGGVITMPFAIKNTGAIGYTLENLIISCYTIDYSKSKFTIGTGCALSPGTKSFYFQPFLLAPGDTKEPQWFLNDNLTLDGTRELTCQGDALVCEITGCMFTYTDDQGKKIDFTSTMTNVPARTADILIDFGPGKGKEPLHYRVAVQYKYNSQHVGPDDIYDAVSLTDIFHILDLQYQTGTSNGKTGIVNLDGVTQDPVRNGWWVVAHKKRDSNSFVYYSMKQDGYQPEGIVIGVNDRVEIIYSTDNDSDGLPLRTENLFGTDDTKKDTDGDGLTDFEEIMGWVSDGDTLTSDPTKEDTDGDGISDYRDPDPLIPAANPLDSLVAIEKIILTSLQGSPWIHAGVLTDSVNQLAVDTVMRGKTEISLQFSRSVSEVIITNITSGEAILVHAPDRGTTTTYSGSMPLVLGRNDIELTAISKNGATSKKVMLKGIQRRLARVTGTDQFRVNLPASSLLHKARDISINFTLIKAMDPLITEVYLFRTQVFAIPLNQSAAIAIVKKDDLGDAGDGIKILDSGKVVDGKDGAYNKYTVVKRFDMLKNQTITDQTLRRDYDYAYFLYTAAFTPDGNHYITAPDSGLYQKMPRKIIIDSVSLWMICMNSFPQPNSPSWNVEFRADVRMGSWNKLDSTGNTVWLNIGQFKCLTIRVKDSLPVGTSVLFPSNSIRIDGRAHFITSWGGDWRNAAFLPPAISFHQLMYPEDYTIDDHGDPTKRWQWIAEPDQNDLVKIAGKYRNRYEDRGWWILDTAIRLYFNNDFKIFWHYDDSQFKG